MNRIEYYAFQSHLKMVHPGTKLGFFSIYTILALLSQSVYISISITVIFLMIIKYTTNIEFFQLLGLIFVPVSFAFLGSLSVLLEFNQHQSMFHLNIWGNLIGITASGLKNGGYIFMRSTSAITVLYAFILNTSITDIIYVLRQLKIPEIILDLMVLVYRNIFILFETAQNIYISQKSRLGYNNLRTTVQSTGQLGGRMFVLAEIRAENLFRSMESRCYDGKIHLLPKRWKVNPIFIVTATFLAVLLTIAQFYFLLSI